MNSLACRLIALLVTLAPVGAAMAQDDSVLRAILADKTAEGHILDAAKTSTVFVNNPCPSANFSLTGRVAIYAMPERDGSGTISKGAWKEQVHEEGCGQTRTLNVLASVQGPGKLGTVALLPGSTRGDPLLQKDSVRYAMIAVQRVAKGCKEGYIENTEFVGQSDKPIAGGKGPPWQELWIVVACGTKAQVSVSFVPDATGTTISAGSAKLVPAQPEK